VKKKIKYILYKNYKATNGTLTPFYINRNFPIKIKRFFIIKGKKGQIRGKHAHKICKQFFIPINGRATLKIFSPKKKIITLDSNKNTAVLLPKLNWCEITFKSKICSILVLCDYPYKKSEYITNIKQFYSNFKKK
jgi:oxalate decarboxylase/phosphoglucose isomerase-like protein (cupin superfamily)